jgi:two-component system chemotaxis response regulator CheY
LRIRALNAGLTKTGENHRLTDGADRAAGAIKGARMKTCLVIEDSALVREIAVRILRELCLNPKEAETAEQGVEACKAAKPDVVLLDWDLPSLGALDFLRGVGAFPPEARPLIVLVATENDHQQFTLARAAGAAHHILKPFDFDLLRAKLTEIGILKDGPAAARAAG